MVTPGIYIACFAALSASSFPLIYMCTGKLHSVICFPGYRVLLVCHIYDLIVKDFVLLLSMASIKVSESVYITHLISSLFVSLSLLSFQLCGWMLLLVMNLNTAAKPSFLPVLFDPSV